MKTTSNGDDDNRNNNKAISSSLEYFMFQVDVVKYRLAGGDQSRVCNREYAKKQKAILHFDMPRLHSDYIYHDLFLHKIDGNRPILIELQLPA
jgi:hypothetical protein